MLEYSGWRDVPKWWSIHLPPQLHIRALEAWPLHQHLLCFGFSSGCVMFCCHRFNLYSLTTGEAKHLSMCCSPFLHLHPWSGCSKLLPIFRLGWLPFMECWEFFVLIHSGCKFFIRDVTYKYLFPVCGFLFLAAPLWLALQDLSSNKRSNPGPRQWNWGFLTTELPWNTHKFLMLMKSNFSILSAIDHAFCVMAKNPLLNRKLTKIFIIYLLLDFCSFRSQLWSILSSFL